MTKPLVLVLAFALFIPWELLAQSGSSSSSGDQSQSSLIAANSDAQEPLLSLKQPATFENSDSAGTPSDEVCYRIRAYIFKRDDDHAPKLVGSTTCGPRQPATRDVTAPSVHFERLR